MKHIGWPARLLIFVTAIVFVAVLWQQSQAEPAPSTARSELVKMMEDGNFNDAYIGFRARLFDPATTEKEVGDDLRDAVGCLQRLNRSNEIDELIEKAIATHEDNWRLLWSGARLYQNIEHFGHRISGEFERGQHRGGGEVVNSLDRDRVRSLQLYLAAMNAAEQELADVKREASGMLSEFANALLLGRGGARQTWQLQYLTDLKQLPDYEAGWWHGGDTQGAPVDAEGNPIFYDAPETWDAAQSDGQRWRWLWRQAVEWNPALWHAELNARANLLHEQFGVQTLADYGILLGRMGDDEAANSRYALHTLKETETIAKLANGIKRFDLPDEHNFIKLYQQVLERAANESEKRIASNAARQLASIFENRRQYPRAAEYWRQAQELAIDDELRTFAKESLAQIEGNWGQFETVMSQPAGKGATVDFRFRNGNQVEFIAHEINIAKLLSDVKAYIKSKPAQLEWEKLNVDQIGHRLVQQKQHEYIGKEVAEWTLDLKPREAHFDKRITVTTPLQAAGAYLVSAKMADGNTSKIVLWLADTAIVQKQLEGQALYYVADAVTGQPIAKANVELFGYKQEHVDGNRFRIDTQQFAENSDADGLALVASGEKQQRDRYQWLAIATTPPAGDKAGRLAYLGFHNVWNGQRHDPAYNEVKTLAITDRPVYRPGQKVHFKFWVRHAQYDQQDISEFAHQTFQVEIHDPRNEKVYTEQLTANAYGGILGEFELPVEATLGQYQLLIVNRGGGTFRVEEYKKPEFEVIIEAPDKPVMLGEKFTAKVEARYYFGEVVKQATVKYKVTRTPRTTQWYPPSRWDWLYGPGYWWFSSDNDWYPGWRTWGCPRPAFSWIWQPPAPPEIVAQGAGPIGDDGTLKIEIDTQLAKELHGDSDHSYQIEAEVTDQSRRTIVGTGEVLAARKPFEVFVWVDRGYFRTGDTITVSGAARTPDGKPVTGAGKLKLLRVTYNAEKPTEPIETEVKSWDLPTTAEGRAELQLKASEAGQYRLSYEVTDGADHKIEGGYLFTIVGEGFDGSDFQFSDLELVPDKRNYAPGEKVKLQINTNRIGSTVLLFVRSVSGVYPKPQVVRLQGKSTIVEIDVAARDMPNFFIEAATVAHGRYHSEQREIAVPPASRVLNVEALPSADAYQPGQEATVKVKLTDDAGKAFVGETVITIYDKSVEYISGGSNVPDIRKFFWEWKRTHHPQNVTNLGRVEGNLVPPGEPAMQYIGVFGQDLLLVTSQSQVVDGAPGSGAGGRMRGMALGVEMATPANAPADAMAMAKADGVEYAAEGGQPEMAAATVRTEFADTALWNGSLETNSDGLAEVKLKMPENLTTWKIRVWAMGQGTRVGEAAAETVTRKNLLVRLQTPRFLVETDEVVLSANVHNYLPDAKQVRVRLELEGNTLEAPSTLESTIEVAAGGEQRVDWRVKAVREGEAIVRAFALTDAESDAMELKFPVLVHGMEKMDSYSGVVAPDAASGQFVVTVPEKRRPEQTRLEVRYSPTLAGAMVDALPYMIDYPYGCTEQTLNRFLPAVVTQRTLQRLGVDLKALQEQRNNLNPQELGDPAKRAEQWKRFDANPVFSQEKLDNIVKSGVRRLTDMQLSDGGWGWFSGWGEHSTPHMTAIVVRGLIVAKENDVAIVPEVQQRGVEWLQRYQAEQIAKLDNVDSEGKARDKEKPSKRFADNMDALVYHILVEAGTSNDKLREYLYRDRTKLAVYGLASFGLALEKEGQQEKLAMVVRNIGQFLVKDDENQTAYLNLPAGYWWYWYGSEYEAQAYYLKLLVATDPKGDIAPRLVKYLLNNRKHATYWNSTRDTALVIEAMADYLAATGEAKPDMTVEVWVDGQRRKDVKITPENLFTFDNALVIEGDALAAGEHTIELRKTGDGRLYWNGYLTNFTLEDDIKATGLELRVNRKFYKLVPVDDATKKVAGSRGQVLDQRVEKYERQEIPSLAAVTSGDLVEVEFTVESKNDYEYILIVDPKAAGFEPVDVRSGYTGNALSAYVEFRDETVNLFVRALARGNHSAAYRLRAEIPGEFSALPTVAYGMYAPELKGNSDEWKVRVEDREVRGEERGEE
ncbi:MAG: MG2 domain-containing protein [Pirellulales bacterium]